MDQIGRYQIVGELGRGAMGVVFRALDPSIGREVAIKIIRLGEFTNAEQRAKQRERLFREARSAGILSHPGIVTIYDMAEQDDMAYIAMEFVSGSTLEHLLSLKEPLEPEQTFSILRQTAAALDYAHLKGIVHRDIKPANIIVNETGVAKIADFGIAKVTTADQLTQAGLIVGTPNYMSPEQVQGKAVEGLADQYSLAVVAYEMFTGEKPFMAEQITTLIYQIVCEQPPSAQRLNPTLGPQIETVLQKGLSKQPGARYPSCTALIDALEAACAATPGWKSLERGASLNLPTMVDTKPEKPPSLPPPPVRALPAPYAREEPEKKSSLFPMIALLALAGVIGAAIYYVRESMMPAAVPAAPPPAAEMAKVEPPKQEPSVAPEPAAKPSVEQPVEPSVEQPDKPQPEKPQPELRRPERVVNTEIPRPPVMASSVEIPVRSEPPGATVMLDGSPGCVTPCVLKTTSGAHTVSLQHSGYKRLTRSIKVTETPFDLPVLTMAQEAGILLVQTQPEGATVMVDNKRWPGVTPLQLNLPPGNHVLTLEKGALHAVQTIEIRDGDLRRLALVLNQQ